LIAFGMFYVMSVSCYGLVVKTCQMIGKKDSSDKTSSKT